MLYLSQRDILNTQPKSILEVLTLENVYVLLPVTQIKSATSLNISKSAQSDNDSDKRNVYLDLVYLLFFL